MTKEEQSKESLKQRDSLTEGRNGHAVHRDDPRVTQIGVGRRPADDILLCTGADRGIRGKKGKRTGVRFPFFAIRRGAHGADQKVTRRNSASRRGADTDNLIGDGKQLRDELRFLRLPIRNITAKDKPLLCTADGGVQNAPALRKGRASKPRR